MNCVGSIVDVMAGLVQFAMTSTLKSKVTFSNGGADQSNFHDYPLQRIDEMPAIVP